MKKFPLTLITFFAILSLIGFKVYATDSPKENNTFGEEIVEEIIQKLQDADIPISYYIIYDDSNDPNGNSNPSYLVKANFADDSFEKEYSKSEPLSGTIEVFNSYESAKKRADYLKRFTGINDFGNQIIAENILLRLNTQFDKEYVEKYAEIMGGSVYTYSENLKAIKQVRTVLLFIISGVLIAVFFYMRKKKPDAENGTERVIMFVVQGIIAIVLFFILIEIFILYPTLILLLIVSSIIGYILYLKIKIKYIKRQDMSFKQGTENNGKDKNITIQNPTLNHMLDSKTTVIEPEIVQNVTEVSKPSKKSWESELHKIDSMLDGHDFEDYVGELMKKLGYENVKVTKGSGDFGVDVLAEKNKIKYAVQCKRYSQNVGISAIQEVYSGIAYYHCHIGIVATNQYFTKAAREHAAQVGVILWDRDELSTMLKAVGLNSSSESGTEYIDEQSSVPKSESFAWSTINDLQIDVHKSIETQNIESSMQIDVNSALLTAGEYICTEDIEPGQYVITAIRSSGSLYVYRNGENHAEINTFLSSDNKEDNISQYRVNIRNGDRMVIKGFEAKISRSQKITLN